MPKPSDEYHYLNWSRVMFHNVQNKPKAAGLGDLFGGPTFTPGQAGGLADMLNRALL